MGAGKHCCVVSGGELGACAGNIPSSLTFNQLECLADLTCKRSNEKCYAKNVEFEQVQIETPSALMAVSSEIQDREVGRSESPWYTGEVYLKTGELIKRQDGADKDKDAISFECAKSGFGGSACPDKHVSVVISGIQSSIWEIGDAGKQCCVVSGGELGAGEGNIPSSLTFNQLECLADLTCKRSNEKCYAKNVGFEQVQIETPSALMAVSSEIQDREVGLSESPWYTGEVYLKTGELIKR